MGHVSHRSAGVWSVVEAMSRALNQLGDVDATVFGLSAADTSVLLAGHEGLSVAAQQTIGPSAIGYAPTLAAGLAAADLDVLHAHGLWMYPSWVGMGWARRSGRPHVVSPHGMLDPWALRHSHWKKRLAAALFERNHLRQASCLHALCASELAAIRQYGLRNPVCVIPNGVDLPVRSVTDMPPWQAKVEEGKKVLLYLGRIHPKKGLRLLLEGLASVRRTAPALAAPWVVAVAGWDQGGHEASLRQQAATLGIGREVIFLGPLYGEAKAAAFAHADAFVLPSLSEGLPMTVLEAWSHGLPVIMTPECHLPEGVDQAAAIEVTATGEGVASGLARLFEMSDAARLAMGRRGLELVRQRYTWSQVANRMLDVYQWLLGGGNVPEDVEIV